MNDIHIEWDFPNGPITHIGQLYPDMFSLSGGIKLDNTSYVVTFSYIRFWV